MPQPNQVIIPPQRKRWYRVRSWIWVIFLVLSMLGMFFIGWRAYLRHRDFENVAPSLILLYFIIGMLRSQWLTLLPIVLTVTTKGLQLQAGAFPFRKRWLAPWKDAALLRYDHGLILAGAKSWLSRTVVIETHLSDTSRGMLIARLNELCLQQGITLPSEDARIKLHDGRSFQETTGGTDLGKFWKG